MQPETTIQPTIEDLTWQVLDDYQIMLPLAGLLKLVLRFTETVTTMITKESSLVTVNVINPINGPTILDEQNPSVKAIIQGQEVSNNIIDDGSGVNVISKRTCDCLGSSEWDACPFWLRMADTSSV